MASPWSTRPRSPAARSPPTGEPDLTTVTSLLIDNLAQYASPVAPAPARVSALREVEVVTGAAIAIVDGRIAACGPRDQVLRDHGDLPVHDAGGRAAIPGLVDCHTHAAFGRDRAAEVDLRSAGAS